MLKVPNFEGISKYPGAHSSPSYHSQQQMDGLKFQMGQLQSNPNPYGCQSFACSSSNQLAPNK
jgi:hypothetical protein